MKKTHYITHCPTILKIFGLTLTLSILYGCGNAIKRLEKEIKSYGYILYPNPLEHSGPGTLVGGTPKNMQLVASPKTCFPNQVNGQPTRLRKIDRTTLPKKTIRVTVSGKLKLKLLGLLQTANPLVQPGANFHLAHFMELEMKGATIEYMDSVRLTQFYQDHMTSICKKYLDKVGFIIQALRVEEMTFRFRSRDGSGINLNTPGLGQIVDVEAGVNYDVENSTDLVITTPKYIGYQLGALRSKENGMVLYRASKVRWNRYYFVPISVFDGEGRRRYKGFYEEEDPGYDQEFKILDEEDLVDPLKLE